MGMENQYVYVLNDRTGRPKYVGCTNSPLGRYRSHLTAAKNGVDVPVSRWIADCVDSGFVPSLEVLCVFDSRQGALDLEAHMIKSLDGLVNSLDGYSQDEEKALKDKRRAHAWYMRTRQLAGPDATKRREKKRKDSLSKPIMRSDGRSFPDSRTAERQMGLSFNSVHVAIKTGRLVGGFSFTRINPEEWL